MDRQSQEAATDLARRGTAGAGPAAPQAPRCQQVKAEATLLDSLRQNDPDLDQRLSEVLQDVLAAPADPINQTLPTTFETARTIVLRQLAILHPKAWGESLMTHWTNDEAALDRAVHALAELAPMTEADALQAGTELGIPEDISVPDLLEQPGSKLTRHDLGWIRRSRSGRDLAYLWLRGEGEPRTTAEIASITGTSEHAIRETMRREAEFVQVRPEGTWALTDWRWKGSTNGYASAVDVVVDVLRERGPLQYEELCAETVRRYPVTAWRVTQCLSNSVVGINADGLYDLTERGATPVQDREPRRPKTIQVHGDVVGLQLKVNRDLLRGSGIGVNRWLTWHLGLRTAPSARYFRITGHPGTLTVKRGTSIAQISSLRAVAQDMKLVEGCRLVVLLHLGSELATIRHACDPQACPRHADHSDSD